MSRSARMLVPDDESLREVAGTKGGQYNGTVIDCVRTGSPLVTE